MEILMQPRLLITLLCIIFVGGIVLDGMPAKEIRVNGGEASDYEDAKGRIWYGGQKEKQDWGGWIELLPRTANVPTLTADAKKLAKDEGYDERIFHAVSWAQFPAVVKVDLKTGKGLFDVTYLVGEHWSPNNRGFDIIIEDEIVEPLYVTPGKDEIDIKRYEGIKVKDDVMSLEFAGNAKTGKGDLNAMFSGLEVVPSQLSVDPKDKLTTTWGDLKWQHKN